MYVESSWPRAEGDHFDLNFTCPGADAAAVQLSWYYHMYGSAMGTLRVRSAAGEILWSKSGDQGAVWRSAS
eukprot:7386842-Prymnesium_polylepis.1